MTRYICKKLQKIRHWRKVILLTRYAFFAAVVMVVQALSILCGINFLQWAGLMAVTVAAAPILS